MGNTYIDNLDLPGLAVVFNRCRSCSYVTIDTAFGNGCPNCRAAQGTNELLHFSFDTYALLELLADSHLRRLTDNRHNTQLLATVIFFCSLTEVLLYHFLVNLMDQKRIDRNVQKRLLSDNLTIKQRVDRLFPTLTDQSWKEAIKRINANSKLYDYSKTINFYTQFAAPARNKFLHEGDKWVISEDIAENCILHARRLVCFFVELHNKYIADEKSKRQS